MFVNTSSLITLVGLSLQYINSYIPPGFDPEQGTITLMMKNVTPADEGFYVCRAENTEGYATTSAHLVVKGKYPIHYLGVYVNRH